MDIYRMRTTYRGRTNWFVLTCLQYNQVLLTRLIALYPHPLAFEHKFLFFGGGTRIAGVSSTTWHLHEQNSGNSQGT